MKKIAVLEMTSEAASQAKGILLKRSLESLISSSTPDSIVVDFDGISLFSTVFFNNSFAALALVYGVDIIRAIHLKNISEVGMAAYEASMTNAEIVLREKYHGKTYKTKINAELNFHDGQMNK